MFGMLFVSGKFERNVMKPINLAVDSVVHSPNWKNRDDTLRHWVLGYFSGFVIYNHNKALAAELYGDQDYLPNVWNAYKSDLDKVIKLKFSQEDLAQFQKLLNSSAANDDGCKDGYTWGFADAEFWDQQQSITQVLARMVSCGDPMRVE